MLPVTERVGEASEFLSPQIPSHFYFSPNVFLSPKFQNLSPIMQCKREQMGKSYVGKGFGGPQRREIWLLNVSHTNLQLPPVLPHSALRMEPARGTQEGQAGCRKGAQLQNSCFTCVSSKMWTKRTAAAQPTREINPKPAWETPHAPPQASPVLTGNWL